MLWVIMVEGKALGELLADTLAEALEKAVVCYRGQVPADAKFEAYPAT